MKKGVRNFYNSHNSTSTINQHNNHTPQDQVRQPTLEEMILQLELEEEIAKQENLNKYNVQGRMSCVNNSDILLSARNALNEYPRFSLDGRDAMHRSSFRNLNGRKSVGCTDFQEYNNLGSKFEKSFCMPRNLAGESVIWCKPGVVAKLMGLEVMPVLARSSRIVCDDQKMKCTSIVKRQNLRRRAERHGIERRIMMENVRNSCDIGGRRGGVKIVGSCSKSSSDQYCVIKPVVAVDDHHPQHSVVAGQEGGFDRFHTIS